MLVISLIVLAVAIVNLLLELKRDLMMLQQNSYRADRYRRWLSVSGDTISTLRLLGMVSFFVAIIRFRIGSVAMSLVSVFSVWSLYRLIVAKYKKPLVYTPRARRIYSVSIFLMVLISVGAVFLYGSGSVEQILYVLVFSVTGVYCISHVVMLISNWLLTPVERLINKRYYDEAADILRSMPDLKVIGVTGSYGKTSTKHYLHRILSEQFDVAMTPGSFNTTLGVVRTIREYLKPYNEVLIVEMGAKQKGDIREICDLVHPKIGIVTAVGPQHLESFKTIDNVQSTKFELIDALPADGLGVLNNDFPKIADRNVENVDCIRYAIDNTDMADFSARDIRYTGHGTSFVVVGPDGEVGAFHTKLVGECNVSNLIASIIVAIHLGEPVGKIRYAVEKIEQVEHRLNMKRTPGGITIIDDAYNSNPVGSKMALDVIAGMKGGRRIIITPGMIELGDSQYESNRLFGRQIASSVDIAIIVGEYNMDAIYSGIKDGGMDMEAVHLADTFDEAQKLLSSIARSGDIVLYENDLPDTFK